MTVLIQDAMQRSAMRLQVDISSANSRLALQLDIPAGRFWKNTPNHFTRMPDGLRRWLSQPRSKTSGWITRDRAEGAGTIARAPIMGMKARISMISGPEHRVPTQQL